VRLRGFGPLGLLAVAVILSGNFLFVPLSALLALAWAHRSRTPWPTLGLVRPGSWVKDLIFGLVLGALFKLALKSLVMPLLGTPAINPYYQFVTGNPAALPGMIYLIVIGAGFGEEVIYRGYLFERLGRLLGERRGAQIAIVAITTLVFAAAHWPDQGLYGSVQAAITGAVFGTVYAVRRQLFLVMVAHAAFDLTALALIYWGLEARVAEFFANLPFTSVTIGCSSGSASSQSSSSRL
jgi:membrane protease YdiL (CAAX protease family)